MKHVQTDYIQKKHRRIKCKQEMQPEQNSKLNTIPVEHEQNVHDK